MVTRAVENAQKQIEELNYERRKNVLKYDEVMNGQREVIYGERRKILEGEDLEGAGARVRRGRGARPPFARTARRRSSRRTGTVDAPAHRARRRSIPSRSPKDDAGRASRDVARARGDVRRGGAGRLRRRRRNRADGADVMRELERVVLLNITDTKWREHLYEMDYLQEGIHLRAYAQQDPLTEYQREAFDMFEELTASIQRGLRALHLPGGVRPARGSSSAEAAAGLGEPRGGRERRRRRRRASAGTAEPAAGRSATRCRATPRARAAAGKKYKKCHGAVV